MFLVIIVTSSTVCKSGTLAFTLKIHTPWVQIFCGVAVCFVDVILLLVF